VPYEAPGLSRASIAERFGVADACHRHDQWADRVLGAMGDGKEEVRPGDPALYRSLYDAGVRYLDHELGMLFDDLRASGMWDNLIVVVTGDHGEEFYEHRGFGHVTTYDENLRVPLIVKWPRQARAGVVNRQPTTSIDLPRTLLEAAGLPGSDLPGRPLDRRQGEEPLFAGTGAVVYLGELKAIVGGPGKTECLFNVVRDPGEQNDLAATETEHMARMKELVICQREWLRQLRSALEVADGERIPLSAEELERLRALGYAE